MSFHSSSSWYFSSTASSFHTLHSPSSGATGCTMLIPSPIGFAVPSLGLSAPSRSSAVRLNSATLTRHRTRPAASMRATSSPRLLDQGTLATQMPLLTAHTARFRPARSTSGHLMFRPMTSGSAWVFSLPSASSTGLWSTSSFIPHVFAGGASGWDSLLARSQAPSVLSRVALCLSLKAERSPRLNGRYLFIFLLLQYFVDFKHRLRIVFCFVLAHREHFFLKEARIPI